MADTDFYLFVSHISPDRAAALEIVDELERRGVRCWIAPRNVRPGRPYDDEIAEAIEDCRAMLLVFSDQCNEHEYIRREVTFAGEEHKLVIPFRIEDARPRRGLAVRLSDLHWIDGFIARERAIDQVLETVDPRRALQAADLTVAPAAPQSAPVEEEARAPLSAAPADAGIEAKTAPAGDHPAERPAPAAAPAPVETEAPEAREVPGADAPAAVPAAASAGPSPSRDAPRALLPAPSPSRDAPRALLAPPSPSGAAVASLGARLASRRILVMAFGVVVIAAAAVYAVTARSPREPPLAPVMETGPAPAPATPSAPTPAPLQPATQSAHEPPKTSNWAPGCIAIGTAYAGSKVYIFHDADVSVDAAVSEAKLYGDTPVIMLPRQQFTTGDLVAAASGVAVFCGKDTTQFLQAAAQSGLFN